MSRRGYERSKRYRMKGCLVLDRVLQPGSLIIPWIHTNIDMWKEEQADHCVNCHDMIGLYLG